MRRPRRGTCVAFFLAIGALQRPAIAADETGIVLVDASGRDKVQAACSACHSLDYVVMNSPFLDKAGWEKTVNKMVSVYGAPLSAADVAVIVEYLERNYGKSID